MITVRDCMEAEALAGAIAIGEAEEPARNAYRRHLATCERCRYEFGGEREIERVMGAVARARDAESWEPDVCKLRKAPSVWRRAWTWGGAVAATLVLIVGIRSAQHHPNLAPQAPSARGSSAQTERALAAFNTQTAPRREHQAESLVFGSAPSAMAFRVTIDARGAPTRCAATQSSGSRDLDAAVCHAALRTLRSRRSGTP
jgi:hypothetical protein